MRAVTKTHRSPLKWGHAFNQLQVSQLTRISFQQSTNTSAAAKTFLARGDTSSSKGGGFNAFAFALALAWARALARALAWQSRDA